MSLRPNVITVLRYGNIYSSVCARVFLSNIETNYQIQNYAGFSDSIDILNEKRTLEKKKRIKDVLLFSSILIASSYYLQGNTDIIESLLDMLSFVWGKVVNLMS